MLCGDIDCQNRRSIDDWGIITLVCNWDWNFEISHLFQGLSFTSMTTHNWDSIARSLACVFSIVAFQFTGVLKILMPQLSFWHLISPILKNWANQGNRLLCIVQPGQFTPNQRLILNWIIFLSLSYIMKTNKNIKPIQALGRCQRGKDVHVESMNVLQ